MCQGHRVLQEHRLDCITSKWNFMDPYTSLEIGCTVTTIDNTGIGHVFSSRGEYKGKT